MTQITDPAAKKKIRDGLDEISHAKTRVAAERDLIKEIINKLHEDHNIEKKILRKMAKVHHEASFDDEVAENDEFEILYETITGVRAEQD